MLTTVRAGREAIFWQTARTAKQARPVVALPTARASGLTELPIVVDSHERYAWKLRHQQVVTSRRPLPAGDYAVEHDGRLIAAVERKSLVDLVATLTSGRMRYLLADLAGLPRRLIMLRDEFCRNPWCDAPIRHADHASGSRLVGLTRQPGRAPSRSPLRPGRPTGVAPPIHRTSSPTGELTRGSR